MCCSATSCDLYSKGSAERVGQSVCEFVHEEGGLCMCVLGRGKAEGVDIAWGGIVTSAHWNRLPYVWLQIRHTEWLSVTFSTSIELDQLLSQNLFYLLISSRQIFFLFWKDGERNNLLMGYHPKIFLSYCNILVRVDNATLGLEIYI